MSAMHEALARELVRALRGRRSQLALSRRLGFESNVLYRWEAGLREPAIEEALRLARAVGIDVRAAMARFDGRLAGALPERIDQRFAAALLGVLWTQSTAELARRTGIGASSLSRVLRGNASLRLSQFLRVLEAASGRLLDWVRTLVDPAALPSVRDDWERLVLARDAATRAPYSEAVLALLETRGYRALRAHRPGWLAQRLCVPLEVELDTLALLEKVGWIRWEGRWATAGARDVDTRAMPDHAYAELKQFWVREVARRSEVGVPPRTAYVVFSCSEATLAGVSEILRESYYRVREALRADDPDAAAQRAALATIALVALDGEPLEARG